MCFSQLAHIGLSSTIWAAAWECHMGPHRLSRWLPSKFLDWPITQMHWCCWWVQVGQQQPERSQVQAIAWAYSDTICFSQLACVGPSSMIWTAAQECHMGPYTLFRWLPRRFLDWPIMQMCWCCWWAWVGQQHLERLQVQAVTWAHSCAMGFSQLAHICLSSMTWATASVVAAWADKFVKISDIKSNKMDKNMKIKIRIE